MTNWAFTRFRLCTMLFSVFFLCFSLAAFSQSGKLKIKVKSQEGPLPGASVVINNGDKNGITDHDGEFEWKNVTPGEYEVKISMLGYISQTKTLTIQNEEKTHLNFTLEKQYVDLQTVEITGRKETGYKNTNSFTATKTETPIREIPQSISYVTKELINDQMAFKMMDVLKNISGVSQNSYTNNKYVLRGFESESKQTLINGLKTFTGERSADILPYVERVEVIKGPASALFANTSPGGTVNIVTKKPLAESRKAINFATGSYGTIRITSDFTGAMNQSQTLLYRLNLAYQNAGSFRELQNKQSFVIAPSVSFLPTDRTRINFDLVFINDNGRNDRGQPSYSPVNGVRDLYATPTSLSLSRVNDYVKAQKIFSTLSLQHNFSNHIAFNASYLKGVYHEDLREHRTANKNAVDEDGNDIPDLMEMRYNYRITDNITDNLTSYFSFRFNTGGLEHRLLTGYDFIQSSDGFGNTTAEALGYLSADGKSALKKYDPAKKEKYMIVDGRPVTNVPSVDLRNPDYTISDPAKYISTAEQDKLGKYYTQGVYIQDQLSWKQFKALLSLRQEFYTDIAGYGTPATTHVNQKALLPRFGLVYTPLKEISLYGTYVYGFQPQEAGYIGDPAKYGGPFDPLESNMIEFGVKSGWLNDRLSATLAVYKIEQNNVLQTANDLGNPDLLRQIGQVRGKGIELDVYGRILYNLSITANLAFNNTEITKSEDKDEIGKQAANAPKSQGGFWAKYDVTRGAVKGLGIALGANFQSKRESGAYDITLPEYTVANAALYYRIDKIQLSATFNNLFNKTYWLGADSFTRLFPGTPRNFLVGVGYTF
ncbi:TonB-dependent siderophore receptor [Terrimonas sp.]|uniref:TonB-dependent receptor n=1 Tax=Terrimonas sp. TaxID=1914338 RepID=UPI000D520A39|nr:TonB-dependent receptor [Terrimonas sp.]PVD49608.1 TonB-dependent siderophore receptor [Terrimonas sp.]